MATDRVSPHLDPPGTRPGGESDPDVGDGTSAPRSLRILILTDRDWTHPQAGGTGANLYSNVVRWIEQGHEVSIVSSSYPGARPVEHLPPSIVLYRMGSRATVFPRAIWAVLRGLEREADVVLEVINGITFLTPLWLRKPRVALVHHPHRDLYVGEFGRRIGRVLSAVLEELPLRLLYRKVPFLTISQSAKHEMVTIDRLPSENISIAYCGIGPGSLEPGERSPQPSLVYVGRLKAYKRIEVLLDMLSELPGVTLDIAGAGDHGETLDHEVTRRGLGDRVRVHGHVSEQAKAALYRSAWLHVTASASEGWSLTVMEAALCATPSAALAVGGLRESIIDGQTGVLAGTVQELRESVRILLRDDEQRERLGRAARERALTFTWDRTAEATLRVIYRTYAESLRRA